MSKKSDSFYYDNFIASISVSCEAAEMLKNVLSNFSSADLPKMMQEIHKIENKGDEQKHELVSGIVKAFITPIERDDIIELSHNIDNVTDGIEDILIHIYITNITSVRKEAIEFADLLINCCHATKELLTEFRNFKKSNKLNDLIIEINRIEEEGDAMYINFMRELHMKCTDPLEIMAWREVFEFFEKSCDSCEHVADIVETIIIGNT
ncbi:MAG: DUF47 family protein [Oscillospiraceae bacterium]